MIKIQMSTVFFFCVLCVHDMRGIDFRGAVQESLGQFAVRAVGAALQEMVQDTVNVFRWAYNKVVPHVSALERSLKSIEVRILDLDKKIEAVGVHVKEDVSLVIRKLKQIPDKRDVQEGLTVLHDILVQEQARITLMTEDSVAAMEMRLKERIAELDDTINEILRECCEKAGEGLDKLQRSRCGAHVQHARSAQAVSSLLEENQQLITIIKERRKSK